MAWQGAALESMRARVLAPFRRWGPEPTAARARAAGGPSEHSEVKLRRQRAVTEMGHSLRALGTPDLHPSWGRGCEPRTPTRGAPTTAAA
eukprot:756372-Alexandrium_andersonii.AAC.1